MLKIYMGRAGAGKTGKIMDEINLLVQNKQNNLILIVPEQYSHDAERLLCEKCGDTASAYAQVLSFTRMGSRVFSELGGVSDQFLDEAGKILVMSRAIELASSQAQVYGSLSKRSEFIGKLVDTSKEFRSSKISISNIIEAASMARPALKDKLNDLAVILQIYWGLMENEVRDPDERLDRLAELLPLSTFADKGHLWFDGFYDFTAQQYCVIEQLLKCASEVTVCITCDDLYSDDVLFENSRNTAKKLISIADELGITHEIVKFADSMISRPDEFKYIEKSLFSPKADVYVGTCRAVSAFSCKSFTEECELAAARSIELVQNGDRWNDIAVAIGNYDEYSAIIEAVFAKYNVPVYQNSKLDILDLPPVLAITSALKIISGGWNYEDVFSYLKTGFTNITRDDCDILENYVLMWNIRGTLWYRDEPWTFSQGGYKEGADDSILQRINRIRNNIVAPLKKLQDSMNSVSSNRDRLVALCEFIDTINMFDQLCRRVDRYTADNNKYMADCYMSLGEIITGAIEQFYNVAGDFNSNMEDFAYQINMLFSQYDLGIIPTSVDSIAVGDILRLRKRNIKHLFIIGMTEDHVPAISHSNGVFSDAERDELISLNFGLAQSSLQRLYGDITAVYDVLTMPSETLTLMYPLSDTVGNSNKPSYIFENIVNCLNIEIKNAVPSAYKIFAKTPCQEYAAISSDADTAAAAAGKYFENDANYIQLLEAVKDVSGLYKKTLTPKSAKMLYGDKVTMTASRVDKYKSCRYAYFLQYGLKAKPRTQAEFDASVIGTFMHYILENVTRDVEAAGGFAAVNDSECMRITKMYVAEFVEHELQSMKDKTTRFQYLFDALTEDAISIVLNMAAELRNSDFRPLDFELDFSANGDLPPYEITGDESSLAVRGVVDRVDGWIHDGKLYIRVVDYKTGIKSFSLSDVWYGMGVQMLLYLFALKSMGKDRYNMEIVPAGVLYTPAREVLLAQSRYVSDAELKKGRTKSLKRSGLILADDDVIEAMEHGDNKVYLPIKAAKDGTYTGESLASVQQLGMLAKHIDKVLLEISKELFSGDVSADPYYRSQVDNSCMYCDYYHACHYSEERDGKYRNLTNLKTPDVWLNLQKEAENE